MTSFAENPINYPDGQINVQPPPDATLANGFIPEQAQTRGMPLPAQWLNWLFQKAFRAINRDKVTDATGLLLFPYANAAIQLYAVDMADPNKFLFAVGFKPASGVHSLKIIQNTTLTLGTATLAGDQPILGGANVRVVGYNRTIGDV